MSSMPPPPGGDQPGYQSAPQYGSGSDAPATATAPRSIVHAKYAMWAGALLQLLGIPLILTTGDELRSEMEKQFRETGESVDQGTIDGFVNIFLGVSAVFGLIFVGLWLLIALFTGKGKGWARIVGSVLFGIYVVMTLSSLVGASADLSLVVNLLGLVAGAVATFFLWQKDSTAWFQAHKAPTV